MAWGLVGATAVCWGAWARAQEPTAGDGAGAAEEGPTPEQFFEGGAKTYRNWIEFSAGAFLSRGNQAQAEERHRLADGAFGGIEDFHYQLDTGKGLTLSADARALFDLNDYRVSLGLTKPDKWFLRVNFENFRSWSNDDGGYYPPARIQYSLHDEALALDRGEVSVEAGVNLEKAPDFRFKYTHAYRDGQKAATTWGQVYPDFQSWARGLGPAFYDLDEQRDIVELDVTHRLQATDLGLGLRYETAQLDNARKVAEFLGEPAERRLTDREDTRYDLFSVHAFSETWLKKDLFFSSGFLFSNLESDSAGSRIYGDDFDVGYVPGFPLGYTTLDGSADQKEYVLNLNLLATPAPHFSIVPSVRAQKADRTAASSGLGTRDALTAAFASTSDREVLDVRERLDLRYTGVTNWVFYAGGEWTQGEGNLFEDGGLSRLGGIGVAPIRRKTDDHRFFQKYSAGARWYPARRLSVDFGGYYKLNGYDYDQRFDSTPNDATSPDRYPAYLALQDFETWDANVRLTLRPHRRLTLVSRYEYQISTVRTRPDAAAGLGEVESSELTSHVFAQNVSWTPWARLFLQGGFNYVVSQTETPAASVTQAILDAQNNYWTLNASAGLVLDDKTDLNAGYFFYRADNYQDNSLAGVPYGAEADEHGVTATLVRRLRENLRLTLRYAWFRYDDLPSGGNHDFEAHVLSTSLQYRF
jgi:hypothetical protein